MPRTSKKSKPASEVSAPDHNVAVQSDDELDDDAAMGVRDRSKIAFPTTLPMLPIRDQVYFPHMMFPLLIGRERSVRAIEEAASQDRRIVVVTQRHIQSEDPDAEDLYSVGIVVEILQ